MKMKRTLQQNKVIYGLFSQLKIADDIKEVLVSSYTNGRTSKTSEMTEKEARQMIADLKVEVRKNKNQVSGTEQKLRREVFKLFYDLQWISGDMATSEKLTVINNWIIQRTKFGKNDLNQLLVSELEVVIKQLRAVRRRTEQKNQEKKTIEPPKTVVRGVWQHVNNYSFCLN